MMVGSRVCVDIDDAVNQGEVYTIMIAGIIIPNEGFDGTEICFTLDTQLPIGQHEMTITFE